MLTDLLNISLTNYRKYRDIRWTMSHSNGFLDLTIEGDEGDAEVAEDDIEGRLFAGRVTV